MHISQITFPTLYKIYMTCRYKLNIRHIIKHLLFSTLKTIFGRSDGLDVNWAIFHIQYTVKPGYLVTSILNGYLY
jgi:hypothetical protein